MVAPVYNPAAMLTPKQAAVLLSISERQIHRLIAAGRIPAKNVGTGASKTWRIKLSDLEAFRDTPDNAAPVAPVPPRTNSLPPGIKSFI